MTRLTLSKNQLPSLLRSRRPHQLDIDHLITLANGPQRATQALSLHLVLRSVREKLSSMKGPTGCLVSRLLVTVHLLLRLGNGGLKGKRYLSLLLIRLPRSLTARVPGLSISCYHSRICRLIPLLIRTERQSRNANPQFLLHGCDRNHRQMA